MNTSTPDPSCIKVPSQVNLPGIPPQLHDDYRLIKGSKPDLSDAKIVTMMLLGNRDTTLRDKLLAQPLALADLAKRVEQLATALGELNELSDEHRGDVATKLDDLSGVIEDLAGSAPTAAALAELTATVSTKLIELGSKLQKLADMQPSAPKDPRPSRLLFGGIALTCVIGIAACIAPFAARRDQPPPAPTTDPALIAEITNLRADLAKARDEAKSQAADQRTQLLLIRASVLPSK